MLINPEMPDWEVRKKDQIKTLKSMIGFMVVAVILGGGVWFWNTKNSDIKSGKETAGIECAEGQVSIDGGCEKIRPEFLDLSEVVRNWGESTGGEISAYVYDLSNERIAGAFHSEVSFEMRSIYKLFVAYEGYRRISLGVWGDDADYLVNEAGSLSRLDCLDLMIRESHSGCAEKMWDEIGREELDGIVRNEFMLFSTSVSGLTTNVADVAKMMVRFYKNEGISGDLVERMKDSFLNQPATNREGLCEGLCDWRQGLPAGFSEKVKVYDKVGWLNAETGWEVYNDAAIIETLDKKSGGMRSYAVVVMTKNMGPEVNQALGRAIEEVLNVTSGEEGVTEVEPGLEVVSGETES
ncbi:MAG: serine hydrolase [Candidatus Saccharibacteria bacterium]|nr:serine hydrolase [Candidatus Saccharibacteria bacterium]